MLPDSAGGYLANWLLFVSILALFNTIQNFVTLSLTKRVYSARPDQGKLHNPNISISNFHFKS